MEKDVSLPPETFRKHVDASLTYINRALKQLSRLFLVEDLVDSLKVSSSELSKKLNVSAPEDLSVYFLKKKATKDGFVCPPCLSYSMLLHSLKFVTHGVCMSEMC